ncbi:MAG: ATP synthase F0 subunit B [Pyrinomonadaceae bacterium]|nr:ATP synthase F0 subunit B [Pyrinomonadaceae bacterium]
MFLLAFAESIQLVPDGYLFLHIALILVMIWALNRTFFKPINAIIEKRLRLQGSRGGEAGEILRSVEDKQKQYQQSMLEARSETYDMIERERAAAVEARQAAILEAKAASANLLNSEKERIAKMRAEAEAEIGVEAERMASKISENILKA